MKKCVYDYIIKPVDQNMLIDAVKRAFETAELRRLRKTKENKLHDSRNFLFKVFNGVSHAIVAIDENTNVAAFNQAAEILFQCRAEEVLGKPFKLLFAENACFGYEIIEELFSQKTVWEQKMSKDRYHLGFHRNDGSVAIVEVALNREIRDDNELMVATFIDVTDKKNEEINLKKSNEKFTKLFLNNPESMIIIRISDSIIIDVNESMLKLSGFCRGEMIGKKTTDLHLWVDPEDRLRAIGILLEKGELKNYECRLRVKDGSIKWISFSVEIVEIDDQRCYLTTVIDISERKKIEEMNVQYLKTLELLVDISAFFIGFSYDDFENMLRIALKKICSIMNAERCFIFFYDFMKQICRCHYDWCDDDEHMVEEKHKSFAISMIEDWIPVHQKKDIVVVEDVEEMERADQKDFFLSQNIKSLMAVPIISNSVDFPAPLGPTTETISPLLISMSIPFSTSSAPNDRFIPTALIMAVLN
jgi:PAS domain S-box-containing protein